MVRLTNLDKLYFPERHYTKGDVVRYYATVAPTLLPHLRDRAMVMKRYPNGIHGQHFFMKRTPSHAPDWVRTCVIPHTAGRVNYPIVQDLDTLLWIVNLGCIDLNPWYARCDDFDRPDYLHFDLDPVAGTAWQRVCDTALALRDLLGELNISAWPKTSGSRGIHVYVPIERGPTQKEVWTVARSISLLLGRRHPKLITSEYRVARRPRGRVLVDYNQNAWGRTLASVYSLRPRPEATVSTPVTWRELERGVAMDDFDIDTVPERIARRGDLFAPLLHDASPRTELCALLDLT